MHISATQLKNNLGQYLESAIKEAVIVEKSGRPASVVISYTEYKRFLELEDQLLGLQALKAEKEGYLGTLESAKLLEQLQKRIAEDDKKD